MAYRADPNAIDGWRLHEHQEARRIFYDASVNDESEQPEYDGERCRMLDTCLEVTATYGWTIIPKSVVAELMRRAGYTVISGSKLVQQYLIMAEARFIGRATAEFNTRWEATMADIEERIWYRLTSTEQQLVGEQIELLKKKYS